ncbi:hypothetical protein ABT288_46215 [Streptomyces sp. NPDC001093]|uniref:hypothetical protein n=1 Tax=Streptomyces sp. NPDC001093 TaxID=3154376 RepID=UPI00332D3409
MDPSYRTTKGTLIAGTGTDPEPETGPAGAAALLHAPQGLFAAVETPGTPDGDRDDLGQDSVA